jgi:hypothetical protein
MYCYDENLKEEQEQTSGVYLHVKNIVITHRTVADMEKLRKTRSGMTSTGASAGSGTSSSEGVDDKYPVSSQSKEPRPKYWSLWMGD